MCSEQNTASPKEAEYPDLNEVLNRYLTGKIMVDDVLDDPNCQREIRKMCRNIMRDADKGADLAQSLYAQILRHESEGPPMSLTGERAQSLRTVDLSTLDEFLAYTKVMALNLARSGWRKSRRRNQKAPIVSDPIDQLPVASPEVSPLERLLHREDLQQINDLPEPQRIALVCWAMHYPTRVIAEIILQRTREHYSHVTVRTWIKNALAKLRGKPVDSIRMVS